MSDSKTEDIWEETQASLETAWYRPKRDVDTIVFVHGILGDKSKTWGKFPKLLSEDVDLPHLDILLWGYKSGLVPNKYQDVETEGNALLSEVGDLVSDRCDIIFVGHSMGGLVILKGIVNCVEEHKGTSHPVSSTKWISLYATPLSGSKVANVVESVVSSNFFTRQFGKLFPTGQLRDLMEGDFVSTLLKDVVDSVYNPLSNSLLINDPIPIRACYGKQDVLVSKKSAIGPFQREHSPKPLDGSHESVKLPEHDGDSRYLALKSDIENVLKSSFASLCSIALDDRDKSKRKAAAARFDRQYGDMARACGRDCFRGRNITDKDMEEVVSRIWQFGKHGKSTPARTMSDVIIDFTYEGDTRLL